MAKITKHKRASEALRTSEEKFAKVLCAAPVSITLSTLQEGRFIEVNGSLLSITGYKREEVIGHTSSELGLWVKPQARAALVRRLRAHGRVTNLEADFRMKSGEVRGGLVSAEIIVLGREPCLLAVVQDVTERKRAEEALRASEERYRDLVENASDIIYTHDLAGNFTSLNKAGERITGYKCEEGLRMNVPQVVAPEYEELARRMIDRKLSGKARTTYELEILARDGRRVALEISSRLIYKEGQPVGVQGIARDVTERKRLEEQLRQAQKMEALGLLASGAAHDFNNVIGAIQAWAELGLKETLPDNPLHRRFEKIRKQTRHAADLTRKLLAFASRQVLEPRRINLNEIAQAVLSLLEAVIGAKIKLEIVLAPDLDEVWADPGQLEQVLMNLCLNAREAMPDGGRLLIRTQNLALGQDDQPQLGSRSGRFVTLSVSDTGVGMDAETTKHMFDPFFTTKNLSAGRGLGLAVVYGIVKQHDGFLYVFSEQGRGTTFCVYLPVASGLDLGHLEGSEAHVVSGGKEMILIAEDHEGTREVFQEALEGFGYRVQLATDGEEAVTVFNSHADEIDLVLLDVVLPKLSGPDAYVRMKQLKPSLPVVFTTGYSAEAGSLVERGFTVLQKPYSPDALAEKVQEVLGREAKA